MNIVEIYPNPLILSHSNNLNYLESKLNIRNLTNEYIIFKLYNNQRSLYSAKPSTSFIPPMETSNVIIKRYKKENLIEQNEKDKDKFLLVFYIINKVISNNEEAKDAFKSKIYKEDSKYEILVPIITKDVNDISINPYDESEINSINDDYIKAISIYSNMNENLRKESNKINNNIKEMESLLEMVKIQKELNNTKVKAMGENKIQKKKVENLADIIILSILLLGLVIGANLAKGYNRAFKKPILIKKEIIINKSENYVEKKINGNNESKANKDLINLLNKSIEKNKNKDNKNTDFLSFSFIIGSYLCLLQIII